MKTVLITGANQGIGLETARLLARQGYFVYLGCRNPESGIQAVQTFRQEGLNTCAWVQLDVTDQGSVDAAVDTVASQHSVLDCLVNNAGIMGARPSPDVPYSVEEVQRVFNTNLFGVMRVTQAFLPLLSRSETPRIVNVTSGLGSLTLQSDPTWRFSRYKHPAYMPSKAALNAYTVLLSAQLSGKGFKVNSVDPGHTSTAFNGYGGERGPEVSAVFVARAATLGPDGVSGRFLSDEGPTGELPW